jgi:hypothetical protein
MRSAILVMAVLLTGCGTLGKLDVDASRRAQLGALDRVVVGEFVANDTRRSRDADQAAKRAEALEAGRVAFAQRIAEELRTVEAFDEVHEAMAMPPALLISGTIDRWEPGNIAARTLVGFVGKSEFEATVRFTDLHTGTELGRLKVDRNSWPLPIGSASNVVQTVEFHMQQAARRVAHELARARGVEGPDPDRTGSPP